MMKRLVIDVTQEDIDRGVRQNSRRCPLAVAARRASGAQEVVALGFGVDCYTDYGSFVCYGATKVFREWMRRFDTGKKVKPRRFVLYVDRRVEHGIDTLA